MRKTHYSPAKVRSACPWFFDMKALMAERPNLSPVSLGDSLTAIDARDILCGDGETSDTASSPAAFGDGNNNDEDVEKSCTSDIELLGSEDESKDAVVTSRWKNIPRTSSDIKMSDVKDMNPKIKKTAQKHVVTSRWKNIPRTSSNIKMSDVEDMKPKIKKTAQKQNTSAARKKFNVSDEFGESTQAMETTRQKSLDLAKVHAENEGKKLQYKLAKLKAKEEERKRKYELDRIKEQK